MEIDNYEPAVVTDERLFSVRDEIGGGFAVRQGGGDILRCLYSTSPMALSDESLHCLAYCLDGAIGHLDCAVERIESEN